MAPSDPQKVKLLCSFGGKILPRPSDGVLRYAGGQTLILSLRRSSTLSDLLSKISQIPAGPISAVKYQLPDEDLDALISVSSQEDLDNMMEEFDRLADLSPDGSARMRIFLFSPADVTSTVDEALYTGQTYIDAVNGVGIKRKESLLSATSSKDGMCPMLLSPNAHETSSSRPGFMEKETLVSSRVEPQHVHLLNPSVNVVGFPPSQTFLHPSCVSLSPENLQPTQGKLGSSAVSGDQIQTNGGNLKPMQGNTDAPSDESSSRSDQYVNNGGDKSFLPHPLSQHPTLHPSFVQNNAYFPPLCPVPQQGLRYADCQMCQRSLPHAHSDTLINEHPNGNGTVSGELQSYHSEDLMKLQSFKVESPVEPKAETAAIASDPFSRQQENGRLVNQNTEVLEHPKVLLPQGAIGVGGEPARLQAPLGVVTGDLHTESEPNTLPTGDQFVGNGFSHDVSHTHEKEKPVHPDIEALDPDKVLHLQREVRVNNVAPSAHFGAYGFTQLPVIPQSYERLHLNPNMHTVIGLPANSHAAYGLFAHASQYRYVDYFPPLSQQMVQTNHLLRQDCRSVMNGNTPPSSVAVPEVSHEYFPPLLQQIVHPNHLVKQDYSSFMNGNLPPSSVSVPKVSHDCFAPSSEQMVHPNHLVNKDCSSVMNGNLTPSSVSVPEVSHDYFPPLSPQNIRPNHLVKQDCNTVMNGNLHLSSASVPEVPHNYARPIDGMMEGLRVNTFEPSMSTEYVRPTPASNLAVPMLKTSTLTGEKIHTDREQVGGNSVLYGNGFSKSRIAPETKTMNQLPPSSADLIKTEHPPLAADNYQALRSQVGHDLVYLGNAHIPPGNLQDCNAVRPVHQIPPPSLDFTCMHTIQPAEMSQPSVIGNHGKMFAYSQEMRVQPEVSNERLGMMPSYSCGISPAYSNGVASLVPLGERKGEALNLHPKDGMVNNVSAPPSVTVPIKYADPSASNGHTEQIQLSTPSELLLCNHDPRKVVGNAQMAPPLLGEVLTKEFVVAKDLCAENYVVNSKDLDVVVLLEEGGLNHLQNPSNKDFYPEPVRFIQGEEQNRQEVQASAEQVLASGLEPSLPPAPVVFPHKRVEADLLSNKESELSKANTLTQAVAPVVDKKIEGITNKQADKMNFSFPLTDDIGRLQIIKNSDLEELRELGSGTFGTVYHGNWRGSDVAIKRISNRCFAAKPSEEERMRADFWKEACMLADLHHPNIVAFYGVVLDGPGGSFATVTEFMVNGSLRLALEKNDKILDKRKRLLIAMDVAFGMEYLHGKNLIHFDLKSDNLLVNLRDPQRPICKVADLGLSKVKHQTLISGGVQGTLPWMAPELLNGGSNRVSQKVDVFSFGIVMWELLTGEEPYADLHYGTVIGGIVSNTLRPSVPETCDADWRSLMEQCWSAEPSERPNFTEIASRLRLMAACFPQKG